MLLLTLDDTYLLNADTVLEFLLSPDGYLNLWLKVSERDTANDDDGCRAIEDKHVELLLTQAGCSREAIRKFIVKMWSIRLEQRNRKGLESMCLNFPAHYSRDDFLDGQLGDTD